MLPPAAVLLMLAGAVHAVAPSPFDRLDVRVDVSAWKVNVGDPVRISLTLHNTSDRPLDGLRVVGLAPSGNGGVSLTRASSVTEPFTILPRRHRILRWTFMAVATGEIRFAPVIARLDPRAGPQAPSTVPSSPAVAVQTPARLLGFLRAQANRSCVADPLLLTLTLSNAGQADALDVSVAAPGSGPSPVDQLPATRALAGGAVASFSWTLAGARAGALQFTVTVNGRDANSGETLGTRFATAQPVFFQDPGRLETFLSVPDRVSLGQRFEVRLSVRNAGGTAVRGVQAAVAHWSAFSARRVSETPGPSSPLAPGAEREFSWRYLALEPGTLLFTASAGGETCLASRIVVHAEREMASERPAVLDGGLSVSATRVIAGRRFDLAVTVTNSGEALALRVRPDPPTYDMYRPLIEPVNGPQPAYTWELAARHSVVFGWTYKAVKPGRLRLSACVEGKDANSRRRIFTSALEAPPVRILSPARLKIESLDLYPQPYVKPGSFVTAIMVVRNLGDAALDLEQIKIRTHYRKGGRLRSRSRYSVRLPLHLEGGTVHPIVWDYHVSDRGKVQLSLSVTGSEEMTGRKVDLQFSVSNRLTVSDTLYNQSVMIGR